MKMFFRPIASDSQAQKRRPRPLKMEAIARIVPPARASAFGSVMPLGLADDILGQRRELGEQTQTRRDVQAEHAQSIHHWGVFLASSKVKDWAAEAVVLGGVKPAGSQPLGGFL